MYKGNSNRTAFIKSRVAQSVQHRTTNLKVRVRVPQLARIFHFVCCRFQCAPGKSTVPIQMKSSMTFIRGMQVHRENERKMVAVLVLGTHKFKKVHTSFNFGTKSDELTISLEKLGWVFILFIYHITPFFLSRSLGLVSSSDLSYSGQPRSLDQWTTTNHYTSTIVLYQGTLNVPNLYPFSIPNSKSNMMKYHFYASLRVT